eukprot:274394-Rhodomonas_salina.1
MQTVAGAYDGGVVALAVAHDLEVNGRADGAGGQLLDLARLAVEDWVPVDRQQDVAGRELVAVLRRPACTTPRDIVSRYCVAACLDVQIIAASPVLVSRSTVRVAVVESHGTALRSESRRKKGV